MPNALETLILADSPTNFYKFVDASGAPADSSGNGRSLAVTGGAPTYHLAGLPNTEGFAMGFGPDVGGGVTDQLAWSPGAGVALPVPFSIEGWFYMTSVAGANNGGHIAGSRGPTDYGCDFYSVGPGEGSPTGVRADIGNPPGSGYYASPNVSAAAVALNKWCHMAWMLTAAGYTVAVNGVQVASVAIAIPNAVLFQNSPLHDLRIALNNTAEAAYRFNGKLAYLATYSSALTVAKMLARYQAVYPPPVVGAGTNASARTNGAIQRIITMSTPLGSGGVPARPASGQLFPRGHS